VHIFVSSKNPSGLTVFEPYMTPSLFASVGMQNRANENHLSYFFTCWLKDSSDASNLKKKFFRYIKGGVDSQKKLQYLLRSKAAFFDYVEGFYRQQRRHSYLEGRNPIDFEKKNVA
jgi:hypothetical protein